MFSQFPVASELSSKLRVQERARSPAREYSEEKAFEVYSRIAGLLFHFFWYLIGASAILRYVVFQYKIQGIAQSFPGLLF